MPATEIRRLEKYAGGATFSDAKAMFQALYIEAGMFEYARVMMDDLVLWPMDEHDHLVQPEINVIRGWAREVDLDQHRPVKPALANAMKRKVEKFLLAHTALTMIEYQKQGKEYARQMKEGTFDREFNGVFGNLNTAWTFGLKEMTNARGGRQVAGEMRVGTLQLNVGSVPKGVKTRKMGHQPHKLKEHVITGEFREVKDDRG